MTRAVISLILFLTVGSQMSGVSKEQKFVYIIPKPLEYDTKFELLCRTWGILKYYHPIATTGNLNCDSALMEKLSLVESGQNVVDIIGDWMDEIDSLASSKKIALSNQAMEHPEFSSVLQDLAVPFSLKKRLTRMMNNKVSLQTHYYYRENSEYVGRFKNELRYDSTYAFPNRKFRLLTLFRMWNAIRYYSPLASTEAEHWNKALKKHIPLFTQAKNIDEYNSSILSLLAELKDGHGVLYSQYITKKVSGDNAPPFELTFYQNKAFVTGIINASLCVENDIRIGDEIVKIEGGSVREKARIIRECYPHQNIYTQNRTIGSFLLRKSADNISVKIKRKGKRKTKIIQLYPPNKLYLEEAGKRNALKVLNDSTGVLGMEILTRELFDSILPVLSNLKVIIFDVRNYPSNAYHYVCDWLLNEPVPFSIGTFPDMLPGTNKSKEHYVGPVANDGNKTGFSGRIIILVDERTVSHAEYTAMALQTFGNATTIGRKSAGAIGDVVFLPLPGNMAIRFSGMAIAYPNGTLVNRNGVLLDKIIPYNKREFTSGHDLVLKAAIEMAKYRYGR